MENSKKKLNILFACGTNPIEYIEYLKLLFDITVVSISQINNRDFHVDLIVFTGGEDVSPSLYGEEIGKYTGCNMKRDETERNIFQGLRRHTPKLGICRGAQFLTVMNKGKLVQHVENHGQTHDITIVGMGQYKMTSTHHQMMYPFNLKPSDYSLLAWSTHYRSPVYLDGNNKQIEKSRDFLEPEIVYYHNSNSLCIQGHPEFSSATDEIKKVTLSLIEELIDNTLSKKYKGVKIDAEFIGEEIFDED